MRGLAAGAEFKQQSFMDSPGWATVQVQHQLVVKGMANGSVSQCSRLSGLGQAKNGVGTNSSPGGALRIAWN